MEFPKSFDSFHHSYLLEGFTVEDVLNLLDAAGFSTLQNPDVSILKFQSLGIGDARALREKALLKPLRHKRQCFVVETAHITHEAQNALLKTLEEPTGFSVFLILVPHTHTLLPTLVSRSHAVKKTRSFQSALDPKAFLAASPKERIDAISELLPDKKKGEDRNLDMILSFLNALELHISVKPGGSTDTFREGLNALYRAKKYCMDRGASHKALLEHVALLVPRM